MLTVGWPVLPERAEVTLDELRRSAGTTTTSVWMTVEQAMMDGFAAVTGDDAFIHVDPAQAAETRFGGTIAHGLLLLSLLAWLMRSAIPLVKGTRMGVNYGYEDVRFLTPVRCGARIRAHFTLDGVKDSKGGLTVLRYGVSMEIEGEAKPALVCAWLLGRWIDRNG
ncbi:MAG: MaoC family dehydratase [Novosphingobium sp.]|nr:MaoC family dehydratase [Novosphingobium sp.]